MNPKLLLQLLIFIPGMGLQASVTAAESSMSWSFDDPSGHVVHGKTKTAEGVVDGSSVFDGRTLIELKDSAVLNRGNPDFTISLWFNPYRLESGQQMLIGKNRYSLDQREWGLIIEPDGKLCAYLRQEGWARILCEKPLQAGHWYRATLVVSSEEARLFLNGKRVGGISLSHPIAPTESPVFLGGIRDGDRNRQTFSGALDEIVFSPRVLSEDELAESYQPVEATHPVPEPPKRFSIWDESAVLPVAADLPQLENVEFHVIKKWDKAADGYTFLHGVGLAWHKGKLYASIGHNKGAENTVTEEAQYRVSSDGGKTWGPLQIIDAGEEDLLAVSHGVFVSHEGRLWAFHGAYYERMKNIHTRAYSLNETTNEWVHHGVIAEDGFWAMNQPVKMDDGNWIMPGGSFGKYSSDGIFPAAVAISQGDNFAKPWKMVSIPVDNAIQRMWGESSIFVNGSTVHNIARYGGGALALAAVSRDYGKSWTPSQLTNLPMATSKPAAGTLSTGHHYLVCTNAKNNTGRRSPLTITLTKPGEEQFSTTYVIRRSLNPGHPGESKERLSLSYPCASEHDGKLYVGYSNNGGRRGNLNSAELAIIPLEQLVSGE